MRLTENMNGQYKTVAYARMPELKPVVHTTLLNICHKANYIKVVFFYKLYELFSGLFKDAYLCSQLIKCKDGLFICYFVCISISYTNSNHVIVR